MSLNKITVSTLVASYVKDTCFVIPPEDVSEILSMFENSPNAKTTLFSGGDKPISQPYKAKSYHGL